MGVYRSPDAEEKSVLPFVITCPKPDLVVRPADKLFVYCNPLELNTALECCLNMDFINLYDDVYALNERPIEEMIPPPEPPKPQLEKGLKIMTPMQAMLRTKASSAAKAIILAKSFKKGASSSEKASSGPET